MTSDPKEIAQKLSKAQQAAVLWCPADGSARAHVKGSPSQVSFFALKNKTIGDPRKQVAQIYTLIERANGYSPVDGKWPVAEYRLSPLGLAVRAELERKERQ